MGILPIWQDLVVLDGTEPRTIFHLKAVATLETTKFLHRNWPRILPPLAGFQTPVRSVPELRGFQKALGYGVDGEIQ